MTPQEALHKACQATQDGTLKKEFEMMKEKEAVEIKAREIERIIREFLPHSIFSTRGMSDVYVPDLAKALAITAIESNARLTKEVEELREALRGLVYHSDKCQGHRNCAEPVEPLFQVARALLANTEGLDKADAEVG